MTTTPHSGVTRRRQKAVWFAVFCVLDIVPVGAVRRTRLTWVNGIAHNLQHMDEGKKEISSFFGGKPVEFCHNPTSMSHDDDVVGYIGDLTQAGTQKLGRITDEVNELYRHLKDAVSAVGLSGRVVHIAHSQGALLTYLAARQLSPLEMSQIEVITFGGAAALRKTPQTPFHRCVNYYSVNDPLLWLVPSAVQALRSGFVGDEFCFLSPRAGDPISDHNLLGETYGKALAWEGQRFQTHYQTLVYRVSRSLLLALILVVHAVIMRILSAIKEVSRRTLVPMLHCVLAILLWLRSRTRLVGDYTATHVSRPVILICGAILEWLRHQLRNLRGIERYEPVPKVGGEVVPAR